MTRDCSPRVGIGAVVLRGNGREVLLVKRGHQPAEGLWSIPGGHLKPGERIFEAALRELEEETGLTGEAAGVINVEELVIDDPGRGRPCYHYIILDVLVVNPRGEVRAGGDAVDVGWFRVSDAVSRDDVTRSTREFLGRLSRGELSLNSRCPIGFTYYTC